MNLIYYLIMAIIPATFNPTIRPDFSRNLLPYASTFNETQAWNVSGVGGGTVVNDATHHRYGTKALRINSTADTTLYFDLADYLNFTAETTGMYVVSFETYHEDLLGDDPNFTAEFYINGINPVQIQADLIQGSESENVWQRFSQIMNLTAGDVVSFKGTFTSGSANSTFWLDGLKVEADPNKTGFPSVYAEPELLGKSVSLTFGTVAAGASTTQVVEMPEAQDGNIVHYGVRNAIMILGGHWGKAWVNTAGSVTIPFKNDTGSSINLTPADFLIKIEK